MHINKKKIIVTGGQGRFASVLKRKNKKYKIFFPDKKKLNILSVRSIRNFIRTKKPDY